ncbi:RE2, partial [Symbiodinium sp. KB8]
ASGSAPTEGATGFQLPWAAIPKFIPGTTDVTEYSRKLEFLAAMWPREHLSLLAPRAALQVEGTAFKKISSLSPEKLKSNDESGIKLLVSTLGRSWGKTDLEAKYDVFEKALYGTVQKPDETNDSYLARHDVHFEELLSQGVTFEQVRAYILLRQSQLSTEDRKKIIVEMGGSLEYKKVCSSIRLLGSRFFADLQGQKTAKTRTYDANLVEDAPPEESDRAYGAFSASAADEGEIELDDSFLEIMVASEDQDALQVQAFEEELENFFQDTPELQEALVSYIEARSRLLAKKKSRGFWPIGAGKGSTKGGRGFKGSGKGKGKHREQLLARIARSTCRICGEKGHWKAECPRRKQNSSGEATTTVAEAFTEALEVPGRDDEVPVPEISTQLPADALSLESSSASEAPPSETSGSSLGMRLARLRDPVQNLTLEQLQALSLEAHGAHVVNFGTKVKGRTFQDVVENEAEWTKWIVEHMSTSPKRSHQSFIMYVEKYVSQAEEIEAALIETAISGEPPVRMIAQAKPKVRSSSKAAPKASSRPVSEAVSEDPWEFMEEPAIPDQVTALNHRMLTMEQMMQVTSCQRELEALLASSFSTSAAAQNLEDQAKKILLAKSGIQVVKNFLKQVPWHELSESSSRDRVIVKDSEAQKPPAYVSFGMYVHGGVVGITKVARSFPWLTRLITYLVRLSDPNHRFTSVGISCNACAEPHRDSYNSERHDNLVIPLEYPDTGGEIWVAKALQARQQSQERVCGRKELSGTLVALKPALHLNPHCWHATASWTGNRILSIGYSLKASHKLMLQDRNWLKNLGFRLPAQHAANACFTAFRQAEDAAWEVYQDSMLSYDQPSDAQLDLLEVYINGDSRQTVISPLQTGNGSSGIPGSVSSDEELSSHSLAEGQDLEAEADNSQTIRLAAGRWHGPAKVICQACLLEGMAKLNTSRASGSSQGPSAALENDDVGQPEQELTPQVSSQEPDTSSPRAPEVERDLAAPSVSGPMADSAQEPPSIDASTIPVPESEDGLYEEPILLTSHVLEPENILEKDPLMEFSTLHVSHDFSGPPIAEDNLPFVEHPLECSVHQAFALEVPVKAKDLKRWAQESAPEQLATIAAVSKRARSEVCVKDLSPRELELFEQAKAKELQCWVQTSAIRSVLRRKLNPEQILRSRWILTWKAPEVGESQPRAKARLVVLGFQDPKLVDVLRDAPTLSKEGRALVLQTIASCKFQLGSFDIKTAFLRGKADESNPLAMEPPKELRRLLNMRDDEVCQLLGNAYGRVDAPLLFYKELSKQLEALGFTKHPLEPCVFLLYSKDKLHGILGVHVDDGVCGGDQVFLDKIQQLQATLPFGSRKFKDFVFTGIRLEQLPDFTIRASQREYIRNVQHIDVGRHRRQTPEAPLSEEERSKLRGLVGSLQYAVTHTRPDVAAKLGEVQSQITTGTVQTLLTANRVLREAQEFEQVCVFYLPIPVSNLTFVSFGDASFASSKNLNSHQGVFICATDERLESLWHLPFLLIEAMVDCGCCNDVAVSPNLQLFYGVVCILYVLSSLAEFLAAGMDGPDTMLAYMIPAALFVMQYQMSRRRAHWAPAGEVVTEGTRRVVLPACLYTNFIRGEWDFGALQLCRLLWVTLLILGTFTSLKKYQLMRKMALHSTELTYRMPFEVFLRVGRDHTEADIAADERLQQEERALGSFTQRAEEQTRSGSFMAEPLTAERRLDDYDKYVGRDVSMQAATWLG